MSLIRTRRLSAEARRVSAYSRCSSERGLSMRRSVIPMTPFIGVRISWLMVARNRLLAWLAAWASTSARRRTSTSASSRSTVWASSRDWRSMTRV
jgi:hypothetical protein